MGDFNINDLDSNHQHAKRFAHVMKSLDLVFLVKTLRRVTVSVVNIAISERCIQEASINGKSSNGSPKFQKQEEAFGEH